MATTDTPNQSGSTPRDASSHDRGKSASQKSTAQEGASTSIAPSRSSQPAEIASTPRMSAFGLMRSFMDDVDQLIGGFDPFARSDLAPFFGRSAFGGWNPPMTMMERDGALVIRADVPGMKPDDVHVEVGEGQLTISGERTEERSGQESGFYRDERSYGAFRRVIGLPEGVDAERVSATFDNGVLEISMPAPPRKKAQRIEVKNAQK